MPSVTQRCRPADTAEHMPTVTRFVWLPAAQAHRFRWILSVAKRGHGLVIRSFMLPALVKRHSGTRSGEHDSRDRGN